MQTKLPKQIISPIQQLEGRSDHIVSLQASVYDLDNPGFSAICSCLPNVVDLHIDILSNLNDLNDFGSLTSLSPDFFSLFEETSSLPPSLERLAITWDFSEALEGEEPSRIPDFVAMRQGLLRRCPALRMLWLDGDLFLFRWRKIVLRGNRVREEEVCERDAGLVPHIRPKLMHFWDGL
ncbi:hypothetical protein FB45DRAFT_1021513 [Roridomyces roridus]|uniref:F-box domain-containing protein n=1 Tax=Roridomyces roridus TaxID=1738132 RepID=A0AAD7CCL3_9AGAR|nr:hypothetical protein FB45DRAFT_1021513 [Roridomyces roridus]